MEKSRMLGRALVVALNTSANGYVNPKCAEDLERFESLAGEHASPSAWELLGTYAIARMAVDAVNGRWAMEVLDTAYCQGTDAVTNHKAMARMKNEALSR